MPDEKKALALEDQPPSLDNVTGKISEELLGCMPAWISQHLDRNSLDCRATLVFGFLLQCIAHVLRQDTHRMLQILNLEELVDGSGCSRCIYWPSRHWLLNLNIAAALMSPPPPPQADAQATSRACWARMRRWFTVR